MTTPPRQGKDGVMEDLIERLIAADGPSRELDVLIGAAVDADCGLAMGMRFAQYVESYGVAWAVEQAESYQSIIRTGLPRYTGSLDAQESLAHPDWQVSSGNCNEDNAPWACVTTPDNVDHTGDGAATEILARLVALLKARIQP